MQPQYSDHYDYLEENHWYFRARRVVLRSLLARLSWPANPAILEVGCGPGHNLAEIYPAGAHLTGVEPDETNARRAADRSGAPVFCATVENLPPQIADASYDAVCLFDVLEHIEDDRSALRILRTKLKPGGWLAVGVPAYQWMWGQQDVVNQHHRRYTLRELGETIAGAGFVTVRKTYYNTLLFPPVAAVRLIGRLRRAPAHSDGDFAVAGRPENSVFYRIFAFESSLLRHMSFPFGVSAFIAARKPEA